MNALFRSMGTSFESFGRSRADSPGDDRPDRRPGRVLRMAAVTLAYYLAVHLDHFLAGLPDGALRFYPALSIAMAAMLLGHARLWPALVLGGLLARASFGAQTAMIATAADVGGAVFGVWLIRTVRRMHTMQPFEDLAAWFAAALTASVWPVLGLLVNALLLGTSPESSAGRLLPFWLGEALGVMVVGPVITSPGSRKYARSRVAASCLILAALGFAVCEVIFQSPAGGALVFLVFPVLILSALLLGPGGANWMMLGLCVLTVHFTATSAAGSAADGQLPVATFLLAVATGAQFLGALQKTPFRHLPYVVVLAGWLLGGWIFWNLDRERQKLESLRFENLIEQAQNNIRQRMQNYVHALAGGAALFSASSEVSRDEWRRYVESVTVGERFPGMAALSVVFPVTKTDLPSFLARMRADGMPDFSIRPVDEGQAALPDPAGWDHFIVGFIEPAAGNRAAFGLDLASERRRFTAARISRDFGTPRVTKSLPLVLDGARQTGFLLFVPMYHPDTAQDTAHKRRKNFLGWVVAPIRIDEFFGSALRNLDGQIELDLYEGLDATQRHLVFRSQEKATASSSWKTVLQLAGEEFTCRWSHGANFSSATESSILDAIMLSVVPILLAGLITSLQSAGSRANALVALRTSELRKAQLEAHSAREIAESANAAKSEFLAVMSHEIRTPINAIIGFTDLLVESPLPAEARSWALTIQTSGQSLLSLINDILDFSKIEAGHLTLERIPLSPLLCAQEVVDLLRIQARQKNVSVRIETDTSLPEAVLGDPVRVRQILTNLVSNALKFTPAGSVVITLSYRPREGLRVSVSDTGIGIPSEKQGKLFQRFSQVDSSTTRRYGGSGLGLAICKRLVEMMGGSIHVESAVGQGTTIWFHAPLPATAPIAVAAAKARPADGELPGQGRHVLVADDIPTNQKLARTLLGRLGCKVDIASSGREAIALATLHAYDVIFMDCQMPDIDGYEATREIRAQETRRVKIFALTASVLDSDRRRCIDAGMDGYLSKPFRRSDFAAVLRSLMASA